MPIFRWVCGASSFDLSRRKGDALEVSVKIGCGLMCTYCPQETHISSAKGAVAESQYVPSLTPEAFENYLLNVDSSVEIKWTAFTEPLASKWFKQLFEVADRRGHQQSISTTLIGNKNSVDFFCSAIRKFKAITIHLPDNAGEMRVKSVEAMREAYHRFFSELVNQRLGGCQSNSVSFFLIGGSVHAEILKVVEEFELGAFFSERLIVAGILNTRNSLIASDRKPLASSRNIAGFVKRLVGRQSPYFCSYRRLNQGVLLPNGNVQICCQDYALEFSLGNLRDTRLDQLYDVIAKQHSTRFKTGNFFPCTKCEHYKPIVLGYTGHGQI